MNSLRAGIENLKRALDLTLPTQATDLLDRYVRLLAKWKDRLNLTGAHDEAEIVNIHLADALLFLARVHIPRQARVIDIGSGAGFPGIPVRVARPDLQVTLLETRRSRVGFLEHATSSLGLNVCILWSRAEVLGRDRAHRERYDATVERATAKFARAVELSLPLVVPGGSAFMLKGPGVGGEIPTAVPLIDAMGGAPPSCETHTVPGTGRRCVIVTVRKIGSTPPPYPRRARRLGTEP